MLFSIKFINKKVQNLMIISQHCPGSSFVTEGTAVHPVLLEMGSWWPCGKWNETNQIKSSSYTPTCCTHLGANVTHIFDHLLDFFPLQLQMDSPLLFTFPCALGISPSWIVLIIFLICCLRAVNQASPGDWEVGGGWGQGFLPDRWPWVAVSPPLPDIGPSTP